LPGCPKFPLLGKGSTNTPKNLLSQVDKKRKEEKEEIKDNTLLGVAIPTS